MAQVRRRRGRRHWRDPRLNAGFMTVGVKNFLPAIVNRSLVVEVLGVQLVFEPAIDAQ